MHDRLSPAPAPRTDPRDPRLQRARALVEALAAGRATAAEAREAATLLQQVGGAGAPTADGGPPTSPPPPTAEVGAALADPARRLGRYVLLAELGRGGMGVVYRAFDPSLQRAVALKVLGTGGPIDPTRRERFAREARAAARLRHAGIVAVHEVGEESGRPFLVMDLVDGEPLDAVLDRGPLPPRRAAEVCAQVAAALAHAHGQGIVHRDVKPANILIERGEGRALLTDFGLAVEVEDEHRLTASGQMLGTPQYMAPEQASPGRDEIGPLADVYGLGGVLYRCLTGRPPFDDAQLLVLIRRVLIEDPIAPRLLNPGVHRDLETIALKCLEKSPARRYPGAAALAEDLARFEKGEPIAARPLSRAEKLRRFVRRRRLAASLLALLGVTVVAIGGVAAWAALEVRRRVAADRAAVVDGARAEAARAREAFRTAREAPVPAEETPEQRARRSDRLLAAGLDALAAVMTLRGHAPEDDAVRREAFEVAMTTGEVALASEQWSVATGAFEKARATRVDPERAHRALERVATERDRVARTHHDAVVAVLDRARSGELGRVPGGAETAVFDLVRYPEAQTVRLLAEALDEVTADLREAVNDVVREGATPTDEEARAGAEPIAGIEEALARWRAGEPGEPPDERTTDLVTRAIERVLARLARDGDDDVHTKVPTPRALMAAAQERRVGPDRLLLARIACEALGHLRIREGAVEPLGRHLRIVESELWAVPPAVALSRLGGERAAAHVIAARGRFGISGPLWTQVSRVFSGGPGEPTTVEELIERSRLRTAQGDRAGARADLDAALARDPESLAALHLRADAAAEMGDHQSALRDLDRLIELAPEISRGWSSRGYVRFLMGEPEAALPDLAHALEIDPEDETAWNSRGMVLIALGRAREALECFGRAIALRNGAAALYSNRARAHEDLGDWAAALADYERALKLDPRDAVAWNNRGCARDALGDPTGAIADYARAIELDPGYAYAWSNRGQTRISQGDAKGAVADQERAVELAPKEARFWDRLGYARRVAGDLAGAIDAHARSIALDPDFATAHNNLGMARSAAGDLAGAVAAFTRALDLVPDDHMALSNRGLIRSRAGDHDGALRDLDRAIALRGPDAILFDNRSDVHSARGDLRAAIADLDRSLALAPEAAGRYAKRGLLRNMTGDRAGGAADLDRAIALDPDNASARITRAIDRRRAGDLAGALEDLDRALRVAPRHHAGFYARGSLRSRMKDHPGAIADLERALELAPDDASYRAALAEARAAAGDREGAVADLERAIELAPDAKVAARWRRRLEQLRRAPP